MAAAAAAALVAVVAVRTCRPEPPRAAAVPRRPDPPPPPVPDVEPIVPKPPVPAPMVPAAADPPKGIKVSDTFIPLTAGGVWGTVTLQGPRPPRKRVRMDVDPGCAALHPEPQLSDELVVGPEGQVRWALVHVTRGLGTRRFEPPASRVQLEQVGCRYVPHVLTARVDQPVEIVNRDRLLHNVHLLAFENPGRNFGQLQGGEAVLAFGRPEIIPVKCDVHPWMKAWIAVFEHPYVAVTDEEGRYRIPGLPAGRYELTVWHESLTREAAEVDVGPDGECRRDFLLQRR